MFVTATGDMVNPAENTEEGTGGGHTSTAYGMADGQTNQRKAVPMSMSSRSGQVPNSPSHQGNALQQIELRVLGFFYLKFTVCDNDTVTYSK